MDSQLLVTPINSAANSESREAEHIRNCLEDEEDQATGWSACLLKDAKHFSLSLQRDTHNL